MRPTWLPLTPFNWRNVKEKLASLRGTMATDRPLSDSTRVRPGEGASWVESPHGADYSQRVEGGSAASASVNGVPPSHLTLSTIIAGFAAGGVVVLAILMTILWSEYRLNNLHLADMKAAMLRHGIDPNPHMPGESP